MRRRHRTSPLARLSVVALTLALGSCAGLHEPVGGPEPPAPSEVAPAPAPATLERADALFAAGDHAAAVTVYGDWLRTHGTDEAAGRALFQQALAHMAEARGAATQANDATGDVATVRALLSRLVEEYPASPYAPAAAQMLDWLTETEDLRQRLEALKRIDLGASSDPSNR